VAKRALHHNGTLMANTKSAKKATRKIARRTEINKNRRSRMRSHVRAVEDAIAGGDPTKALSALKAAEPELMRAAQRGVMHKKTASRKVSRLTHQIGKLAK
jgi:small subunit ribosomal protein S20